MSTSPLDQNAVYSKYDKKHTLESIRAFPDQCAQAWKEALRISIPKSYRSCSNIVVSAMGGSGLGAHLIKAVFEYNLAKPVEIVNHYALPSYVGKETLVLLTSYSGTTEEVLSAAIQAKKRNAKLLGITAGGELGVWLRRKNVPSYFFNPLYNISGQPRLGTGYLLASALVFLQKVGALKGVGALPKIYEAAFKDVRQAVARFDSGHSTKVNAAKKMALNLFNHSVLIFGSEHLVGNAHIFANQINETAKQFAAWFTLPEMNHHLLEGLTFPRKNANATAAVFFESDFYHLRVRSRYKVAQEVLQKQRISSHAWHPHGATRFSHALETYAFGAFTSFYLALLNRTDPSKIPWVDYFKKKLAA